MLRGNRDNIATVFRLATYLLIAVGFLTVVWQISGTYAERRQNAEHRARQYADSTDRRVASACAAVERAAVLECVTQQVKAAREDERTEYDLQAQQDSADAAFWVALISFATLAATFVALWLVKGTLDATREAVKDTGDATAAMQAANEIAERTAQRELRPYLWPSYSQFTLNEGVPIVTSGLKNYGQTPALSHSGWTHTWLTHFPLRDDLPTPAIDFQMANSIIPPSAVLDGVQPHGMALTDWDIGLIETETAALYFYGAGTYLDMFGKEHFYRFIYFTNGKGSLERGRLQAYTSGNVIDV